jgi:post-segregation antitoxin (ccd killing protein)
MSNSQAIVTAKIPVKLKKKLKKLKVNVSGFVREALEAEVERLERERLKNLMEEAGQILQKIPAQEIVEAVQATRENR